MAETTDGGMPSEPGDLPEITADASAARPIGRLKMGERWFSILSLMDVPVGELQSVLEEQRRLAQAPATWSDQLALARREIRLLVPDLTETDLNTLTARQIVMLSQQLFTAFRHITQPEE
jgi:hypothetical protein